MFERVETTLLDNGIRVITSAIPHVASVSGGIWVSVGSRHESRQLAGVSHFLEHLLFKGSHQRSALSISRAIEGRGGYLNAFTQEESTCYYFRVPSDSLRRSSVVLTDMFRCPRLARGDIEKERQVIIEEIMMYRDEPAQHVMDLIETALWPGHPLGRPTTGDVQSIGAMPREAIVDFHEQNYTGVNTVFAFAGNLDHQACAELVAREAGSLPCGRRPRCRRFTANLAPCLLAGETRAIEQTHLAFGFRLFGRRDPRRFALQVLNTILGGNMSSRLFQSLRERQGLAYSVQSAIQLFLDTGSLVISVGVDRRRAGAALRLMINELDRLRSVPVSHRELIRARDYVTGQLKLSMESTGNQMMWLGDNVLSWNRFISPRESLDALLSVTADDVMTLAGTIFQSSAASLAYIAPTGSAPDEATVRRLMERL